MKKSKIMTLLISVVMLVTVLTGCMGVKTEISFNPNGSGQITSFIGFTEEGLKQISEMNQEVDINTDASAYEYKVELNGKTYYGENQVVFFSSIEELNAMLKGEIISDATSSVDMSAISVQDTDNGFILTIDTTSDVVKDGVTDYVSGGADVDVDIDEETIATIESIMNEMVVVLDISYPNGTVSRLDKMAIPGFEQVSENCYRIDFIKFAKSELDVQKVSFLLKANTSEVESEESEEPEKPEEPTAPFIPFDDVKETDWYYKAVTRMAQLGIVKGVGDNKFNPEGMITYAELCEMIARENKLETGKELGYWASLGIKSCLENEYIKDLGDVIPANYNVAISREAAVAAMYRAFYIKDDIIGIPTPYEDIPDLNEIDEEYRMYVQFAYAVGLTKGSDSIGTFLPKDTLTRAEVCQLFYNMKN